MLGKTDLDRLLSEATPLADRLIVSPLLESKSQVGAGSIDVRLGTSFIVTRNARVGGIQPFDKRFPQRLNAYQEKLYVPLDKELWIHPGTFVLGCTFEYIRLPNSVYAEVTARSSWARLGLNIASAVAIHPGYYGCLTLELVNGGNTPVAISPGARIGQLTIYQMATTAQPLKQGKYMGHTSPEPSHLYEEADERRRWIAVGQSLASKRMLKPKKISP